MRHDPHSTDVRRVMGIAPRVSLLCGVVAALAVIAAGSVAPAAAATSAGTTISDSASLEAAVLAELNVVRRAHGLKPLRRSAGLAAAADVHSRAMAQHGFFQHDSRDGSSFSERVQRFYGPSGHGTWSVGENLLWATRGINAKRAVTMWMQSPGHRQNILTPQWREIGLAAVTFRGAPGVFGGMDVVIFTTDFGVR
jgi:uncharacterized protein YkwD